VSVSVSSQRSRVAASDRRHVPAEPTSAWRQRVYAEPKLLAPAYVPARPPIHGHCRALAQHRALLRRGARRLLQVMLPALWCLCLCGGGRPTQMHETSLKILHSHSTQPVQEVPYKRVCVHDCSACWHRTAPISIANVAHAMRFHVCLHRRGCPHAQAYLLTARTSSKWLLDDATSTIAAHACQPSYSNSLWSLLVCRARSRSPTC
jgi:hypothetical protein